jgi:hypothetical protein
MVSSSTGEHFAEELMARVRELTKDPVEAKMLLTVQDREHGVLRLGSTVTLDTFTAALYVLLEWASVESGAIPQEVLLGVAPQALERLEQERRARGMSESAFEGVPRNRRILQRLLALAEEE